jgi:catechol 2,3-dioxygenase-like lactoylglutathione lyase family enzyme
MSQLLKIDNIMFFVKDLEKAAQFYEQALGMTRRWTDEERGMIGLTFAESDSEIVIHTDSTIPNPDFSFLGITLVIRRQVFTMVF